MKKTIINDLNTAQRADVLLASAYPEYSRAALAKLFDMEQITKSDVTIKAGDRIQPGVAIDADVSEILKKADVIELPIVYEDANVIVINKPAGIISHARGRYWDEASVASFVRDRVSGLYGERAGIVHRLDRATSGVMVCAKNSETVAFMQKQFSSRNVYKTYIAIVQKDVEQEAGIIDVPLARNPKNPKTFRPDPSGKEAKTEYKVVKSGETYSTLQLHPLTGRTHQLRVHLQYIKHPIVGDELYGGEPADRLYLHAASLEITLPGGERTVFTAPVPPVFSTKL